MHIHIFALRLVRKGDFLGGILPIVHHKRVLFYERLQSLAASLVLEKF